MSDKTKRTPGPWAWTDGSRVDTADGLYTVATANAEETYTCDPDLATAYANARLIASAPCLLRALRGSVEAVDPGGRGDTDLEPYFTGPVAAARLAIAQATGQEVK